MTDWLVRYWLQTLFGLIVAALSAVVGKLTSKLKGYRKLETATKAMMLDRIVQAHRFYTRRGLISALELKVVEDMNDSYRELGGNGLARALMDDLEALPVREAVPKQEKEK